MLLDKVAPANVEFQRYVDNFEEYLDLNNNERLDEDEMLQTSSLGILNEKNMWMLIPRWGGGGGEGTSIWTGHYSRR